MIFYKAATWPNVPISHFPAIQGLRSAAASPCSVSDAPCSSWVLDLQEAPRQLQEHPCLLPTCLQPFYLFETWTYFTFVKLVTVSGHTEVGF